MATASLQGLRVVDLSSTLMGPYSTMLLGQWGADVIKVESPEGDVVRYIGDERGRGMGPIFLNTNRGKRSIALDLKSPEAADVLRRLVTQCDLFVHNLSPLTARRLGVTGEEILAMNPKVVCLSFRGYGAGGEYEDQRAYDDIIQAMSGLASLQRPEAPEYIRSSVVDKIVGLMGAAIALAALRGAEKTGVGASLDVPMFETMVGFNLLEQQGGQVFGPDGGPAGYARTRSEFRKPYRTQDSNIAVMVYTDAQWRAFFEVIGRSDLAGDERYSTIRERTVHSDELYRLVEETMLSRTSDEWLRLMDGAGIAASRINSIDDVLADPHLVATGFFQSVNHPSEGGLVLPRIPGPVADAADDALAFAPLLGEHSRQILQELGYSADAIGDLMRTGTVSGAVLEEA